MSNVVSLAEVRAARQQLARPAAEPAPPAASLRWRQSARGNWWAKDPRSGLHLVIYETKRGWSGRATAEDGQGWYVNLPPGVSSLAEAQAWSLDWFGRQEAKAAGSPHSVPGAV